MPAAGSTKHLALSLLLAVSCARNRPSPGSAAPQTSRAVHAGDVELFEMSLAAVVEITRTAPEVVTLEGIFVDGKRDAGLSFEISRLAHLALTRSGPGTGTAVATRGSTTGTASRQTLSVLYHRVAGDTAYVGTVGYLEGTRTVAFRRCMVLARDGDHWAPAREDPRRPEDCGR